MKVSVSLPDGDVEFLDRYVREQGYRSRSAVVHKAVRLLRAAELGDAYAGAWDEWENLEEGVWGAVIGDG
jgi:Arc/MetJ-type ribon-helix-helix transcriptional regulator